MINRKKKRKKIEFHNWALLLPGLSSMAEPIPPPLNSCCFSLKSSSTAEQTILSKLVCLRDTQNLNFGLLDELWSRAAVIRVGIDPRGLKQQLWSSEWGTTFIAKLVLPMTLIPDGFRLLFAETVGCYWIRFAFPAASPGSCGMTVDFSSNFEKEDRYIRLGLRFFFSQF